MEGKRAKHDNLGCEVEGTKYSVNLRTLIQAVTWHSESATNHLLAEMVLPSPAQVQKTAQRLDQKGWKEYLIEGSGWKKIFLRISKSLDERKLNRHAAKGILDDVWSTQPKRNSVMIGVGLATGLAVALGAYC